MSVAPGDEDAVRCKVVALIKCDRIDEALSVIPKVSNGFGYFKVYFSLIYSAVVLIERRCRS